MGGPDWASAPEAVKTKTRKARLARRKRAGNEIIQEAFSSTQAEGRTPFWSVRPRVRTAGEKLFRCKHFLTLEAAPHQEFILTDHCRTAGDTANLLGVRAIECPRIGGGIDYSRKDRFCSQQVCVGIEVSLERVTLNRRLFKNHATFGIEVRTRNQFSNASNITSSGDGISAKVGCHLDFSIHKSIEFVKPSSLLPDRQIRPSRICCDSGSPIIDFTVSGLCSDHSPPIDICIIRERFVIEVAKRCHITRTSIAIKFI